MRSKFIIALATITIFCSQAYSQDDLMDLLNEVNPEEDSEVTATFKAIKIINAQSIETTKKNNLDFRITHRFGSMGVGGHTLYGLDEARDIRFSFDYGLSDRIAIGIGRSKIKEHIDGSFKYAFLKQSKDKIPFTAVLYTDAALSAVKSDTNNLNNYYPEFVHRLTYTTQILLARKFSKSFSFELLPTWVHRNRIIEATNEKTNASDVHGIFALGFAARVKITSRTAIVADYFLVMSDYRNDNPSFANPLAIGVELETGGHVFHINLTNSNSIIENDFIPNTSDSWLDGGYKLGFNISRVFDL
ncbi:MAG: hypothetical protein HRT72_01180 [Flavobacteriales bacterium]|nr:hypothetical protein [Flavobacteriales bacterium]